MTDTGDLEREVAHLRARLSRLSEASLRINESLDFETVLQGVLDSARSLTGATYGVVSVLGVTGEVPRFLASGMEQQQARELWDIPGGAEVAEQLGELTQALRRIKDFRAHLRGWGMPDLTWPIGLSPAPAFLGAPIRHRGETVGNFYLLERQGGGEFTGEDEETLAMFASEAALVIVNARTYRDEQRARADLETLVHTAPVGVVVLDARNPAVRSVNREAMRIGAGLLTDSQSVEDLLRTVTVRRADGREFSLDHSLAEYSASETVRAEEVLVTVPDGRNISVLLNATPIHTAEGALDSYVVTMQDLAPLKELERLRAEFLAMVSHELRTPLTSIKGSIATLLDSSSDLDPAEADQFFRIIDEQSEHMRYLISDLLDVARIETGTLPVTLEPSDVRTVIEEARTRFASASGENDLHVDLSPNLPHVMADRRRIVQVLSNLLSNASRYSPTGSGIRITAVQDGVHVAFSVVDRGSGLPEERLPDLFRKFTRIASEHHDHPAESSGLGLAICRGIVEAHGGRIWAESDGPGRGTRFTFTVPAVEATLPQPTRLPNNEGTDKAGHERILVVDDDPETLRYVRDVLSNAGYSPVVTGDPDDVPGLIEDVEPHLVLLDLILPDSDGIAVMGKIFAVADIPVIFLSVYGRDKTIAEAFENGASDYVVKPFSPTELVARIRAALRRRVLPDPPEPARPYVLGDLTIDYARRAVSVAGQPLALTAMEYRMLRELSVHAGVVLTYDHLLQRAWGRTPTADRRPMRTVLRNLRRKLGDDANTPRYIFTEPRVGYRMPEGA